ncbi:MAG: thioredoxin domain-containing protein [Planctomycetota bacterium]
MSDTAHSDTHMTPDPEVGQKNRLADSKSPYLLQHADNPVDWYPWGEEAFAKAKKEDKPIFLSIGYSTCHWCHVMAHESFEDPEVARLMNEALVSIKVDREERPDIDNVYMTVCQMMTGSGGWPLTILMTPERKPFFAATYIPKTSRFGRTGMVELIPKIQELWETRRDDVVQSADQIVEHLRSSTGGQAGEALDPSVLALAADQLAARFDATHGGFGGPPKFPTPHNLTFLLRHWKRAGDEQSLKMVEETLRAMRLGGVYDHVGFGFHRYSTDARWLVPHFEKMLYDQALLAMAYVEAFQATGKADYERTARQIFTYVLRDMTAPQGGFYSAEDADSEGVEGKFYVWTVAELREVLGGDDGDLAIRVFNATEDGNFIDEAHRRRTGTNILHLTKPLPELADDLGMDKDTLRERLEGIRRKLCERREKRVHPHKDDKVLTDWNGLMIAALAKGARAFGEPRYAEAATKAARFLLGTLRDADGRLLHRFRAGHVGVRAHLDDYAFLAWGLIELYEATFDVSHLAAAQELTDAMLDGFWDEEAGGFFFTADTAEGLLVRQKESYDGAVPSGNSVAMLVLLRLARITGRAEWEARAEAVGRAFASRVRRMPAAHTQLMAALDFAVGPSFEVVIAGQPGADDTEALLTALRTRFLPNKVVLLRPAGVEEPPIARIAPFVEAQTARDGRATAYVCRDQACREPTTKKDEMLNALAGQ